MPARIRTLPPCSALVCRPSPRNGSFRLPALPAVLLLLAACGCSGDGDGSFDRTRVQGAEGSRVLRIEQPESAGVAAVELALPARLERGASTVEILAVTLLSPEEAAHLAYGVDGGDGRVAVVSSAPDGFAGRPVRIRISYRVMGPDRPVREPFEIDRVRTDKVLDTRVVRRPEAVTLRWEEEGEGPSASANPNTETAA